MSPGTIWGCLLLSPGRRNWPTALSYYLSFQRKKKKGSVNSFRLEFSAAGGMQPVTSMTLHSSDHQFTVADLSNTLIGMFSDTVEPKHEQKAEICWLHSLETADKSESNFLWGFIKGHTAYFAF